MAVKIGHVGKSAGVGQAGEKWEWKVFVDEDEEKLNEIEEVEYSYPTVPPQKNVIKDRESAFAGVVQPCQTRLVMFRFSFPRFLARRLRSRRSLWFATPTLSETL